MKGITKLLLVLFALIVVSVVVVGSTSTFNNVQGNGWLNMSNSSQTSNIAGTLTVGTALTVAGASILTSPITANFDFGGFDVFNASNVNSTTVTATTITDGTTSITGGDITGVDDMNATTFNDGTTSITGGDITGVDDMNATTFNDGTAKLTGGDLTGVDDANATSFFQGGNAVADVAGFTMTGNIDISGKDVGGVAYLNFTTDAAHHIYDNATCVIIVGDTSTLNIC